MKTARLLFLSFAFTGYFLIQGEFTDHSTTLAGNRLCEYMKELDNKEFVDVFSNLNQREFQRLRFLESTIKTPSDLTVLLKKVDNNYWKTNVYPKLKSHDIEYLNQPHLNRWSAYYAHSTKEFLRENKMYFLIFCSLGIGVYLISLFELYTFKKQLEKIDTWCNWKNELDFLELNNLSPRELQKELIKQIFQGYGQEITEESSIKAIQNFILTVKTEIKILKQFIKNYQTIQKPLIKWLFPNYDKELYDAKNKLQRLVYLLQLISYKFD